MRTIYYEPAAGVPRAAAADRAVDRLASPGPFRSGSAGRVDVESEREIRSVAIGPNGYHGLVHFGVLERLRELPHEGGPLRPGAEVVFFPATVEALIERLYAAERLTYEGEHDILVARCEPRDREYRLRLDRRDYQRTLIRLIDLMREAAHEGHAIRLSL